MELYGLIYSLLITNITQSYPHFGITNRWHIDSNIIGVSR